ncbi:MAG TPA: SEC-C metal-binding domain-containing protein [Actinomycetes bacterium]|jgi:hypothetical protein|nr:SEC-C metal-binding domain-containing protein [Actinomycetes bacterium]
MTTRTRRFPTDAEVDAWMAEHFVDPNDERLSEQTKAAHSERMDWTGSLLRHAVSSGAMRWAYEAHGTQHDKNAEHQCRSFTRMYLAAESAGIEPLCAHVYDTTRPLFMQCDPPIVVCRTCLPQIADTITAKSFRWNHVCDRCGADAELLSPSGLGIGTIFLNGHVCSRCSAEDRQLAWDSADEVVPVGRNMLCLCGSGRKYKHCHGRPLNTTKERAGG